MSPRINKTTKEIVEEASKKINSKREPLSKKELQDLTEEKYTVAKNPSGYYLLDKKGKPLAAASKKTRILEAKRRFEERDQGIEHKSVDILKKG